MKNIKQLLSLILLTIFNNSILIQNSQGQSLNLAKTLIEWTPQTGTICYRFRKDGTRFIYTSIENQDHVCNTGKKRVFSPLFPTSRNSKDGKRRATVRTYPKGPILCILTEGEVNILEYKINNWHITNQCGNQIGVIHSSELDVGDSELEPRVYGYCFYNGKPIPDFLYCPFYVN